MRFDEIKVGEVCTLVNGYAFKSNEFQEEGIPVIKIANVKPNKIILDGLQCVSPETAEKHQKNLINYGDIILTMTGNRIDGSPDSWVGKSATFRQRGQYLLNQRLCIVRPNEEKIDAKYFAYVLASWDTQLYFIKRATSSGGQANISPAMINDYLIPYPSKDIQKKIASILSDIDEKIEINNELNDKLTQQARILYKAWFVDFVLSNGEMPLGWRKAKLSEIAEIVTNTYAPQKNVGVTVEHYSIPAFDEKHFPVFELTDGIKSNKYKINHDSIMISKLNPTTKRIWRPLCLTDDAICSTEFIVYEAKNKNHKDFVYSVVDSSSFNGFLCSHTTGSTNSRQRAMPKATMEFELILPTEDVIEKFCSVVTPMYEMISNNIKENQKLIEVRDVLLSQLLSGEIDLAEIDL